MIIIIIILTLLRNIRLFTRPDAISAHPQKEENTLRSVLEFQFSGIGGKRKEPRLLLEVLGHRHVCHPLPIPYHLPGETNGYHTPLHKEKFLLSPVQGLRSMGGHGRHL